MARYQRPEDPREGNGRRPRRLRGDEQEPIPWAWFGAGLLVALLGIVVAISLANALLSRPPLTAVAAQPTIIVLTAPPSPVPTNTPQLAPPTPIPPFTPVPTPDNAVAPTEITPGFYAQVTNTNGLGVSVRSNPGTSSARLLLATERTVLLVLDGPESADNFFWWQVRLDDGTEGWVAGDFLIPAPAP